MGRHHASMRNGTCREVLGHIFQRNMDGNRDYPQLVSRQHHDGSLVIQPAAPREILGMARRGKSHLVKRCLVNGCSHHGRHVAIKGKRNSGIYRFNYSSTIGRVQCSGYDGFSDGDRQHR